MNHPTNRTSSSLDRRSCAWTDAIGRGYATGVSERMLEHITPLDQRRYCH